MVRSQDLVLNLLMATAILLASSPHKAHAQDAAGDGGTCPEKLTLDDSCLPPLSAGQVGSRTPAWLLDSEEEAFSVARCYVICAQDSLESYNVSIEGQRPGVHTNTNTVSIIIYLL